MAMVTVSSKSEMEKAIRDAGGTPSPIPQGDLVDIGNITILRAVRETSFRGCNHSVSTTRFSGEHDFCAVCQKMRTVR